MKTSNLNGYYTHKGRICIATSFAEKLGVIYFEANAKMVYLDHDEASAFKPLTLEVALATNLHETRDYVRQVERSELVNRLERDPLFALLTISPCDFKPGMALAHRHNGNGGSCGLRINLRSVGAQWDDKVNVNLSFSVTLSYFDENRDDDIEVDLSAHATFPRAMLESFNVADYNAWASKTAKVKRTALREHFKVEMAKLRKTMKEVL